MRRLIKKYIILLNKKITMINYKYLHQNERGFKYVCNSVIFQKGEAILHFSSTCLCNPEIDGALTVKYENESMHCFVCIFGISQ